jgi:hypothetical protein
MPAGFANVSIAITLQQSVQPPQTLVADEAAIIGAPAHPA